MNYKVEELYTLVKALSEKYTGKTSTSITYEAAEQLMGSIIYCINEYINSYSTSNRDELVTHFANISAKEAYDIGYNLVIDKIKDTHTIYNNLIIDFNHYDNIAYKDTIVEGIPEFFKWYDPKLNPQNNIILLDYPILKDLHHLQGIDLIYEYLQFIDLEQQSLKQYPEEYIKDRLNNYHHDYENLFINISEIAIN